MLEFDLNKMLFNVPADKHGKEDILELLGKHPEVQFVSFAGIDIAGNDTDERIPMKMFIKDMDDMLVHGVQTDGSSVDLPKIADLNNGKVDLVPDLTVNWFVDYNYDNIDLHTGLPVGTLRIPAYLVHNEKNEVGARSILKNAIAAFKEELMEMLERKDAPVWYLVDREAARKLIDSEQQWPWYGQLMRGPQTMAYLLQIDYWLRKYRINFMF